MSAILCENLHCVSDKSTFSVYISNNRHNCIVEFACFRRTFQLFCQTQKPRQGILANSLCSSRDDVGNRIKELIL